MSDETETQIILPVLVHPTSYRPTLAHSRIIASAVQDWLDRIHPRTVVERVIIATETTVTRTVVAIERTTKPPEE